MAGELTIDRRYFEEKYAASGDPWNFLHSWYERRKYDLTLAALPEQRYARAFEPGCSIGVLSERLAQRCDELVAMELLPAVASEARERLRPYPHASVVAGGIPGDWPDGSFDLIVLSEVGYYLTPEGLEQAIHRLGSSMRAHATLVSVHYTLETNYPLPGGAVGEALRKVPWLNEVSFYTEQSFELLVLRS
ncbi:MAG: SAM-dependent methyltransferase [Tepidiformaceae bacterium]